MLDGKAQNKDDNMANHRFMTNLNMQKQTSQNVMENRNFCINPLMNELKYVFMS